MLDKELISAAYAGDVALSKASATVHHTIAELDRGALVLPRRSMVSGS